MFGNIERFYFFIIIDIEYIIVSHNNKHTKNIYLSVIIIGIITEVYMLLITRMEGKSNRVECILLLPTGDTSTDGVSVSTGLDRFRLHKILLAQINGHFYRLVSWFSRD